METPFISKIWNLKVKYTNFNTENEKVFFKVCLNNIDEASLNFLMDDTVEKVKFYTFRYTHLAFPPPQAVTLNTTWHSTTKVRVHLREINSK